MSKIQMEVFCKSEKGFLMRRNEDFIFSELPSSEDSQERLFILADGFGGNINSNLAVKVVVETLSEEFYKTATIGTAKERLKKAVFAAQKQLGLKVREWNTPKLKIGLMIGLIQEEGILAANLGGGTVLLSAMTEGNKKEYLTLLPAEEPLKDDADPIVTLHGLKGQNIRLCLLSDGFRQWLETKELEELFKKHTRQALVSRLFHLVDIDKAEDNVSILLVEPRGSASHKKSKKPFLILALVLLLALVWVAYLFMQSGALSLFFSSNNQSVEAPVLVSSLPQESIPESILESKEEPIALPDQEEVAPVIPPPPAPPVSTIPPVVTATTPPLAPAPTPLPPPVVVPSPAPSPRFEKVQVVFSSKQTGTKVFINGNYRGTTPLQVELSPGTYQILYSRPLFGEKNQTLTVRGDAASASFSMDLRQETYAVNILSEPSGSKVYINGKYEGLTPIILELKPGSWNLTLSRPGYNEYHEKLVIEDTQDLQAITRKINLAAESNTDQSFWLKMECF